MSDDLWDEAQQNYQDKRNGKAFWTLPHDSLEDKDQALVHSWLMSELEYLKHENRDRLQVVYRNLELYKGIQYRDQDSRQGNRDASDKKSKAFEKIVQNHLFDLSRSRTSKLLKYKPGVSILPTNDEWSDDISAKMTKLWLDHVWYMERFDGIKIPLFIRNIQPMGECYFYVDWDPDKGDLSRQYKEAKKAASKNGKGSRVPLLDENGNQEKDSNGNPIWVDQPVYNGDISYRVQMTTDVFPQRVPSGQWDKVDYVFDREVMNVEEARLRFPQSVRFIKSDKEAKIYNYEKMESVQDQNLVEIWTLNHRRTKAMDKGRKIYFTKDGVLSNTKFPFTHRMLPCVRMTDVDNPGELHGTSFFDKVKGSTGAHNNLTNMILRNHIFVGHPKWMLPAGSAKIDSLGNTITTVQYKGPIAPSLVVANPSPPEVYKFRDVLKEDFMSHADVGNTSRGTPPAGITAAVALQYLSELENERWNESVLKYNEVILQIAILTIAVGGDYYDDKDERMIRLLGQNNKWISMAFDVAHLQKDYDVRVSSSSALPESKSARTEYLLYLNERFPDRVDADSVLNLLDLAQSDKFINMATVSVRAAEAENEMLMDEKKENTVNPPSEEEDQIEHWKTHVRKIRDWSFKNRSPEHVQNGFKDHLIAHEMLITKKIMENAVYGQSDSIKAILMMGFPLFFKNSPNLEPEEEPTDDESMVDDVTQEAEPYNAPIEDQQALEITQTPELEVNPDVPSVGSQLIDGQGVPPELEQTNSI